MRPATNHHYHSTTLITSTCSQNIGEGTSTAVRYWSLFSARIPPGVLLWYSGCHSR